MENPKNRLQLNRRTLLAGTGSAFAAGILAHGLRLDASAQEAQMGRLFLNPEQAKSVEAIAEVMWPTTDKSAGGRDAGVMHYIDRALFGPYSNYQGIYHAGLEWLDYASIVTHGKAFASLAEDSQLDIMNQIYDGELGEVSAANVSRTGQNLITDAQGQSTPETEASPVTIDENTATPVATTTTDSTPTFIDGVIVAGSTPTHVGNLLAFMEVVRVHVMEGLFSDPAHGGNKDFAGWAAVGYPGPYVVFTEEQQQSFEPLDLPFQSIADL